MSNNILIISGHPDLNRSIANKVILDELAYHLPNAQIRKLDALYPNWQLDVQVEQDALLWADIIVLQFPFSWYSMPALLKKWLDEVFLHGFSHGSNAKLGGKKLIISTTTGAPEALYQKEGFFGYTINELMHQFEITAKLCGLDYQSPIVTYGVSYSVRDDEVKVNAHRELAKNHAKRLILTLQAA